MNKHKTTPRDAILLPGADFYGVLGFVNAIISLPPADRPHLYIRLIGVLEHATSHRGAPEAELIRSLKKGLAAGISISLSAETPRYAAKLAEALDKPVEVTPYPCITEFVPPPTSGPFNVLCAGSARLDKGFDHLLGVAKDLAVRPSPHPILLISQTMPVEHSHAWDNYTSQLYAAPGVRLLEPVIDATEMADLYRESHVVLLPYVEDVYRFRGSAVMMEAAAYGRLCVTLKGPAFATQVDYYDLGEVLDDFAEIPDALRRLAAGNRDIQRRRILQARTRYFADVDSAYDRWFERRN